ncbi:zinc-binding dehydrogenase [Streptomyces sp. 7-21]|uniref:zinc-binding dehydrogenase n=1 Tax=Streptomyces sp. 7-21 TaxID=2802283 RepID=UPI00191F531C|nr:zinc-binding dehydrogenase [Streptomyces sp. 7-21]MBL1067515.1 zinc-binding dehydrogenase [Streptomyces sp. 7-21]
MRVVRAERFGGPDVLRVVEEPVPVPGPGQVVIDVEAVDTLFMDTQIRAGLARQWFPVAPPFVPGSGAAGRVSITGEGVETAWTSRRVIVHRLTTGAYAERVVAEAEALLPIPEKLGTREAAALIHDGTTAMAIAEPLAPRPGEWVLITAAAGGMGVLLVQLARTAGARVIAAARGERKLAVLREFGAEAVVDYSEPGWTDTVRGVTGDAGVDVLWDGAGGGIGRAAFPLVRDGGRVSAHGAASGGFAPIGEEEARRRGITLRGIGELQFSREVAAPLTARALEEAAAGRLAPVIGQTFPLDRAAEAHAAIESRQTVGKTLLLP